jgi:hypothetical protein
MPHENSHEPSDSPATFTRIAPQPVNTQKLTRRSARYIYLIRVEQGGQGNLNVRINFGPLGTPSHSDEAADQLLEFVHFVVRPRALCF